jgi:Na+/proline symporter
LVIRVVGFVTAVYTMKGGLSAVVFYDASDGGPITAAVILTAIGCMRSVGSARCGRSSINDVLDGKTGDRSHLPWPGVFVECSC